MQATIHGVKKACPRCGKRTEHEFLVGFACVRCDKIVGDVEAEMVVVSGQGVH
ncbi:MAG: hypothetical protein KJ749_00195 [Planctomycetes bacterium]|nr:hypothetical protein [Planctomycetota bacterium]